jgi:hypothetical protein
MARWLVCGVLAFGLVAACTEQTDRPPTAVVSGDPPTASGGGGGGGRSDGGSGSEGGADGGACTDLTNTGTLVDRTGVPGDPPTALGGTVVDGDYDLSAYTVYVGVSGVAGPTGITAKSTIRISGGKIDQVLELGGTGKTTTTTASRSAFSASGATFAETELCPSTGAGRQLQFTAADPILTLTDATSKEAFTFTKR